MAEERDWPPDTTGPAATQHELSEEDSSREPQVEDVEEDLLALSQSGCARHQVGCALLDV
jgi:hypothetical protein